jgi:hypothetical protein
MASTRTGPTTPHASRTERALRTLIEGLDLDAQQKVFMTSRWLDQVVWMDGRADRARRMYFLLRMTTILGGVVVPALIAVNATATHLIATVISVCVAASAAVEEFFHYGERWRHYRLTAESLKSEGWRFLELAEPYRGRGHQNHREAYQLFADRVERLIHQDVEIYLSKVVREPESQSTDAAAPPDKDAKAKG